MQVGDPQARNYRGIGQPDVLSDAGEEWGARAQHHGDEVDLDGIEKAQCEALAGDVGAGDGDVLLTGRDTGSADGCLDTVGDELEARVRPVLGGADG